jgi:hypothetical protein
MIQDSKYIRQAGGRQVVYRESAKFIFVITVFKTTVNRHIHHMK